MTRIAAMINQKGGVGKTTACFNIASGMALIHNQRVLAIDLDPQGSLTRSYGINGDAETRTVYELLKKELTFDQIVRTVRSIKPTADSAATPLLDLIPAGLRLSNSELEFMGKPSREYLLHDVLKGSEKASPPAKNYLNEYDWVFIDCPPSLSVFTINALTMATDVIICYDSELYAMYGMNDLVQVVDQIKSRPNPDLKILGVLATKSDRRRTLHAQLESNIRAVWQDVHFQTSIRMNSALSDAPYAHKSVFEFAPKSTGAQDYAKVIEEIRSR